MMATCWQMMVRGQELYTQALVQGEGDAEGEADEDGNAVGLESLISQVGGDVGGVQVAAGMCS
jgi:hypothetical protein